MREIDSTEPHRQVAYVHGQWRVTYRCPGESGQLEVRSGLIVGPLVSDLSTTAIWVAVKPDGSVKRTLIRRDSIISIAPPRFPRANVRSSA